MGFNLRGDKSSFALLSSKRIKAYTRTKADEAFALPSFSDAMPVAPTELPRSSNSAANPDRHVEQNSDNVKHTMLQHESVFKEQQLHELHRLYQKQCVLMAESQKGHACHPRPEPPSSNSSFLYNSDSFKPQEDRSFGDASVSKPFDNNGNLCVFPTQMIDVKPFEVDAERQKQVCDRPMLDLEQPAEGCPIFDLERPAKDLPFFDLERPAEEYMHVEVGKDDAGVVGPTCTLVDAKVLSSRHSVKENRVSDAGENRDLVLGKNKDPWGSKRLDFCTSYDCKDTFGSKGRLCEVYLQQHASLGCQRSDSKQEHYSSPIGPFAKTVDYSHQDPFPCPVKTASASGLCQGLPDLNGGLSAAENQTSLMQRKPEKNVNVRQYIDLEADSSTSIGTSKLPHWLVQPPQPPPKASRMSVITNFSTQSSEWDQKVRFFAPEVHEKSNSLAAGTPIPGVIMKTSTPQEPYHSWSHSKTTYQQKDISFQEPLSLPSFQFFSGANTGAPQGSYKAAHISGSANESIPSFLPYVSDNDKRNLTTASGVLSSVDRQDIVFDARAASMELLSRIGSRETTALSPVLPWYQQKDCFPSLMEPPFHRPSYVSSVDPWGPAASRQVLPISGMNNMERGVHGMQSIVNNFQGPCLATRPESLTNDPVYDFLPNSTEKGVTQDLRMKGNEVSTWRPVEKPFYVGQIPEKTTSSNHNGDSIPSRVVFDLNVSSEPLLPEENFDPRFHVHPNQKQCLKQECETIGSSGWEILRGNKAPCLNEEPKEMDSQATAGFADTVANKVMAFDVSTKGAQLPTDSTFFTRPGTLCSQTHRLGNDTCTDCCSGEDETGGGFVEVKSSDASGLTSCESRDAAHLELTKARDDSNTSSGEACQSRESGIPYHMEDVALSSTVQSKRSTVLPLTKANGLVESQQWGSFLFSTIQSGPGFDTKGDCSALICTEFGDESEAANSVAKKHSMETAEAAELLLSLGVDLPPVAEEGYAINDHEKSLDWLANIIPQEENCETHVLGVDTACLAMHEDRSTLPASTSVAEKDMDAFELAVLALKPIDPEEEGLTVHVMDRASLVENCSSFANLRRRSSRRGRAGKDFQREMLRSMTSLSRHEITEDLQIIEGLINSTTEAMNSCLLFPEDKPVSSPDSGSQKKARGTKAFRGRKPSETLNVCSWGESTRRKRMGRQRSQRSCLPPGVQSASFVVNNTGDGVILM